MLHSPTLLFKGNFIRKNETGVEVQNHGDFFDLILIDLECVEIWSERKNIEKRERKSILHHAAKDVT